ncbi:MAG: hypothetical protein ACI9VS_002352 [Candidatus Binatia bacterium]|jgi:hypothetical protein
MAGEISRPAVAEPARFRVMTLRFLVIAFAILTGSAGRSAESNHDAAAQADEPPKLKFSDFPRRPRPLIELGDKFLSEGNLRKGFTLPTGAVWTPNLWVYGNFRSAVQSFDSGAAPRSSEWVNRLDLFGNLELSPTERVVIGIRPFDHKGDFTGFNFEPATRRGFEENFNATSFQPRTLFFEGEFGEIFPGLDDGDRLSLDYGISVGRQPLRLQDGLLLDDDALDLLAFTRNAILPRGGSHLRVSTLFGWNEVDRGNNAEEQGSYLLGLDSFLDLKRSTIEWDLLYVLSRNQSDGFYAGLGAIQRLGKLNTTFRVAQSVAIEQENARVGTGTLLFSEFSYTPSHTHDIAYLNGFWGINEFTSAGRDPFAGGPLGRAGLTFAAVGLGRYGSPLNNRAANTAGGALGYQLFLGERRRRQVVAEIGVVTSTNGDANAAQAVAARYQQAFGRRTVLVLDAFGALREDSRESYGGRLEFLIKF